MRRRQWNLLVGLVALLTTVIVTGPGLLTPDPAVSAVDTPQAMIVVFHPRAGLEPGRRFHLPDRRAATHPEAWRYLDTAVLGTTQVLEVVHGFLADHVYSHALRGFAGRLTARQVTALRRDPRVAFVEPDQVWTTSAQLLPWGIDRVDGDQSSARSGNGSGAVTNVNVYVIDTGIGFHADLNLVRHVTMLKGLNTDCHGHGTHVAGTIAARDNGAGVVGMVPGAPLTGVKVLGCNGSGSTSTVIKGVDWVTANARRPAVANMSLGGPTSTASDQAIRASVASGIFYAVAAGNSGADACGSSPARLGGATAGVMTVAATDPADGEASWSNYGACVDVWAPGVNIPSTRLGGGSTTMSGTSMATPHVTGTAALYLSTQSAATPAAVEDAIRLFGQFPGTSSKDGRRILLDNSRAF